MFLAVAGRFPTTGSPGKAPPQTSDVLLELLPLAWGEGQQLLCSPTPFLLPGGSVRGEYVGHWSFSPKKYPSLPLGTSSLLHLEIPSQHALSGPAPCSRTVESLWGIWHLLGSQSETAKSHVTSSYIINLLPLLIYRSFSSVGFCYFQPCTPIIDVHIKFPLPDYRFLENRDQVWLNFLSPTKSCGVLVHSWGLIQIQGMNGK